MMTIPEYIKYTDSEIDNVVKLIRSLTYADYDIRKDHYLYSIDILKSYQRGVITFEISKLSIEENLNEKTKDKILEKYIIEFGQISTVEKINFSHRNQINRSLIIDIWSQFEFSITTICGSVLNSVELDSLYTDRYEEIVKLVGQQNITVDAEEKLRKKLTQKHLTHVPITRKCDKLFKYCKDYNRDINADKKFLQFFGKVRNTMHSSYIYYGNDFEYVFENIRTVFENGKPVYHRQPIGLKFYFDLAIELTKVFTSIVTSIDHSEKIEYPTMADS
jgi:hypothetical protein